MVETVSSQEDVGCSKNRITSRMSSMGAISVPVIFPGDRFPSFDGEPNASFPREEFGPPLSFDVDSPELAIIRRNEETISHQFVPLAGEIQRGLMEILYNVLDDEYVRKNCNSRISGWKSCTWRYCNVEKKLERDWNTGYLARRDDHHDGDGAEDREPLHNGLIEWRFNLRGTGLRVKDLKVRIPYKVYRDGKVKVTVCSTDDYTVVLDPQHLKTVHRALGWEDFVIRVELSGEKHDPDYNNGYQNAQLFRQPLDKTVLHPEWSNPFKIMVEMEKSEA